MKVTILGCGTSGGVPRLPGIWGACDPTNPKNRRRRVSVLVEQGDTTVVIDTSPDFREQMLDAGAQRLDGVFYTHDHADHTHGIDDLRSYFYVMGKRIDIWANAQTLEILKRRFDYIFSSKDGYPAICEPHEITGTVTVGDITMVPFPQIHGPVISLGYRFGKAVYSTDLNDLTDKARAALEDVDLWIVDALRYRPHPTHSHVEQTLRWIEEIKPKRAVLTHMTHEVDYETLKGECPPGVEPAYDGMVIELDDGEPRAGDVESIGGEGVRS